MDLISPLQCTGVVVFNKSGPWQPKILKLRIVLKPKTPMLTCVVVLWTMSACRVGWPLFLQTSGQNAGH